MTLKKLLPLVLSSLFISPVFAQGQQPDGDAKYRPNFHFAPKEHWMNDPNGLFYADGVYHLYFQYWPYGSTWGPMHWGHATSKDLVKWEEQPIALYPDRFGYIFSGSAVQDTNNSSGLGKNGKAPAIAIFTYHDPVKEKEGKTEVESQGLAYSNDNGYTWTKFDEGNPVIKNPGIRDFRDPKVSRDWVNSRWILVLAAQDRAQFFSSENLKDWKYLSDFGKDTGAHGGVWECPDFFPLKVDGTNETKWVLIQSLNPGGANGGSGTQYFIGDFTDNKFVLDKTFAQRVEKEKAVWIDYGRDNYAAVTWGNTPDEEHKKYLIGWLTNWDYANVMPTQTWRGANTVARELKLIKKGNDYSIVTTPVNELKKYITNTETVKKLTVKGKATLIATGKADLTQADISLNIKGLKKDVYTLALSNADGDVLKFGIDNKTNSLFLDRSGSSNSTSFHKFTAAVSKAPLIGEQKELSIRFILDTTSIEIFYNNGEKVFSEIFYTKTPFTTLSAEAATGFEINNLTINQMKF
ncbi:MAG: glycoside hydrolase family 32 protein [Bacteroidia bacterium]